jgi:hypothetical protein
MLDFQYLTLQPEPRFEVGGSTSNRRFENQCESPRVH